MARGARIAEPHEFYDRIPVLLTEQATRIAPLVDPGNPPLSSTSRAKTHSTRRCHGMVALAARSSGRSTEISFQTKITTVMLREKMLGSDILLARMRLPIFMSH